MSDKVMGEERACLNIPLKINSPGLLGVQGSNPLSEVLEFSSPRLMLQMFAFLLASACLRRFTNRRELPAIFWQIVVGLILGNIHVLKDVLFGRNSKTTTQNSAVKVLGSVSWLGYLFFLFLEGVKMDPGLVRKVGSKAVSVGILSVVVPVMAVTTVLGQRKDLTKTPDLFFWTTYALTSFPVTHCLLSNLGLLNSELGRFGLSAALINDLFTHALMILMGFLDPRREPTLLTVVASVCKSLLFIASLIGIRYGMKSWIRRRPQGGPAKDELFYTVVVLFLIAPNTAKLCGLFEFSGAFLLGLAVPEGMPLGAALVDKLDPVVSGLLLPLFTVTCALRINLAPLTSISKSEHVAGHVLAILIPLCSKFVLIVLLPLLFKMPCADSLPLAFILSTKGVVELAIYTTADDDQMIDEEQRLILGAFILVLATFVPLIVKKLYDPSRKYMTYKKRNLMHSRLNEELRILTCIDSPANVVSIIHLLDASSPSPNSPIAVDVLHLVQLRGRATPLFISHEKNHSITVCNSTYSNSLIPAFNNFEMENHTAVNINVHTAVSPPSLMHEDICYLALDRLTSFIILPFHRRRFPDGSIESDNTNMRNINCKILDRSPCSVGILVEGIRYTERCAAHTYKLGMIFLGGNDDREALTYASRSAQGRCIMLTVVHLKAASETGKLLDTYDRIHDNEVLNFAKKNPHVTFVEEEVNGGLETSKFLNSIGEEFDLIIVGRRNNLECPQTTGLKEWSEFPELGVIGDLLASQDIDGRCPVLIVQQQQQQHGTTRR